MTLSEAEVQRLNTLVGPGPVAGGPTSEVEIRITGGPTVHVRLEASQPPSYRLGPAPDAATSFDLTLEDLEGFVRGEYDPAVAFMQGTLKVKGAARPLYELFRIWADEAHRQALRTLSASST